MIDPSGLVDVVRLLNAMPFDQRETITLTQVFGFSYLEAAAIIGCLVGTVRSRIARGRDLLATTMRASEPGRRRRG